MKPVIELRGVSKHYGNFHALDDINLSVGEGEILGLLGHNGAGKTTTMKLILGVITASSGEVRLLGKSPIGRHADVLRRSMGYLPENVSFYSQMTGREVLYYFAQLKDIATSTCKELLQRVGLSHAADRRVGTYSKGMRQRLGMAQALLGNPKLLLLDEPTAGLDPTATAEFYEMLQILRQQGTSVLLSSHVLPGIERYIDRVAILGGGRLLDVGTINELSLRAQLPISVHARGQWPDVDWATRLSKRALNFQHISEQRLELTAHLDSKLELMRILLAEPTIEDIEIISPSLDQLYAHYNQPKPTEVDL
ncbi:MAG: ABC transporter ATP-binding protein [Gammaproteobacteria bacterium]|nr:ABC transporter ATP-binding protein [Gammaproteobacteria bacterium]